MLVVHVHVQVKAEAVEDFKQATLANARESLKEQGIARFDVVQQQDERSSCRSRPQPGRNDAHKLMG